MQQKRGNLRRREVASGEVQSRQDLGEGASAGCLSAETFHKREKPSECNFPGHIQVTEKGREPGACQGPPG